MNVVPVPVHVPAPTPANTLPLYTGPPGCSCHAYPMALAEGLPFCSPAGKNIRQGHSRKRTVGWGPAACPPPIASLCLDPQRSLASSQAARAAADHSAAPCACAFPPLIASCARSLAECRGPCDAWPCLASELQSRRRSFCSDLTAATPESAPQSQNPHVVLVPSPTRPYHLEHAAIACHGRSAPSLLARPPCFQVSCRPPFSSPVGRFHRRVHRVSTWSTTRRSASPPRTRPMPCCPILNPTGRYTVVPASGSLGPSSSHCL